MTDDRGPWDDLLRQLDGAMDKLELGDRHTRDLIGEGVKDALRGLFPESDEPARKGPDVVVLDGGRGEGRRTEDQPRPPLEVAPPPTARDTVDEDAGVNVRVVHVSQAPPPNPKGEGRWMVNEALATQLLYAGPSARAYRITCSSGRCEVLAHGSPLTVLVPGRTADIEATQIEIRGNGRGDYRLLD